MRGINQLEFAKLLKDLALNQKLTQDKVLKNSDGGSSVPSSFGIEKVYD